MNAPAPVVFIHDDEIFVRMTPTERWQHILLAASFVVLLTTGLPAMFDRGAGARLARHPASFGRPRPHRELRLAPFLYRPEREGTS